MNLHEPIFVAPPITEIPDYVWSRRYDKPAFLPGWPVQKPKDASRKIPHSDVESALKASKTITLFFITKYLRPQIHEKNGNKEKPSLLLVDHPEEVAGRILALEENLYLARN